MRMLIVATQGMATAWTRSLSFPNVHQDTGPQQLQPRTLGGLQKSGLNVPSCIIGPISEFSADDEDLLGVGHCLECDDEILCLTGLHIERGSAKDRSFIDLVTKNALQSESADFLGNGLGVGTIARAEGDTTTNKKKFLYPPCINLSQSNSHIII